MLMSSSIHLYSSQSVASMMLPHRISTQDRHTCLWKAKLFVGSKKECSLVPLHVKNTNLLTSKTCTFSKFHLTPNLKAQFTNWKHLVKYQTHQTSAPTFKSFQV